ncbi:enoyl-CoA hydratase [Alcaligenaceae bacterium]|nr:enoyl-CoA hydratase [Alcaligenaceae bacterium]
MAGAGVRLLRPTPSIARIVMARPGSRNAQDISMTYALNSAFMSAAHDDEVKVIVLSGEGDHFSSGHDLSGDAGKTWRDFPILEGDARFDSPGVEGRWSRETEIYLAMCERWRNIPKPTIAAVQGSCIAGALMLAWACDIIVASSEARFRDPTPEFGAPGCEFFMHPWELGARKAKEWLFMSDWLSAEEAEKRGMVNRVVPLATLDEAVMQMAQRIAEKSHFVLKAIKESVNQIQDMSGRREGVKAAFNIHQLSHAHNEIVHGFLIDPTGVPPVLREKIQSRMRRTQMSASQGPLDGTEF